MRSQTVVVSVALLALCCLLIPRGGESAGGIAALQHPEGERRAGDHQPQDESLDDPESERGLAGDPQPVGGSNRDKRDTEEEAAAQAGEWRKIQLFFFYHKSTDLLGHQRC